MSVNPRLSGFWSTDARMSYYERADAEESEGLVQGEDEEMGGMPDGRTPLDRTIDKIGMGSYQWTLLSLCGFGWLADNMWMQAIAIILPRVQQHFDIPDSKIGFLSSTMFAGMMLGAVGWGTCSDLIGRTAAFNATLFLTAVFGVLASLANTFPLLCAALFFLGSAVGGSMPTDGTLLLEHMPNGKQYLVTALSVFFSFGSVVAAISGLVLIPSRSCPPKPASCDVATQNMGWRYLLMALGLITLLMFLARIAFFRLHESPRYLVHAGRHQEAVESLQMISKFNGDELDLDVEDVRDHLTQSEIVAHRERLTSSPTSMEGQLVFDADDRERSSSPDETRPKLLPKTSRMALRSSQEDVLPDYSATGEHNVSLSGHAYQAPASPPAPSSDEPYLKDTSRRNSDASAYSARSFRPSHHTREGTSSTLGERGTKLCWKLPRWLRRPLMAWMDRISMVLAPEWMRTTVLVWIVWWTLSLAYTMFNIYLPKLLEGRGTAGDAAPRSLTDSLWDVVIYSLGGCPGAILGAYLVDSPLGRRWSLAGSTFCTALCCEFFVLAQSSLAVRISTLGISLCATAMWAVLYGWTPEIFGTKVRGTACGIASALSRIGGMIAPILGGMLLVIDNSFPVYASVVIFLIAGLSVLLLREKEGEREASGGGMMH
ncbi:MFS general substrate transporter [Phanerochaete sordida]|uniref:MFS general substrate transporter n=1 Tax=Phanerochaete sordida TaxID=48140 RepID=A0A9P3GPE5_9APHY|nr:MFS general substrate transporter [Phanerochaete sordida]